MIATFHIETTESNPVLFVNTKLIGIIGNGTFGSFMVDKDHLEVGEFKFGKLFIPWPMKEGQVTYSGFIVHAN